MRNAVCPGALSARALYAACVAWALLAGLAAGQTPAQARARAALALAQDAPKAKPAPAPAATACGKTGCECGKACECRDGECYTCLSCARKQGKPVALWIGGITCKDHADVRAVLPNHTHVHLATFNGSASQRLLVEPAGGGGDAWRFAGPDLNAETVRRTLAGPAREPVRPPAGVPVSYYAPPAQAFWGGGRSC